jgi:hypothetical protein
MKNMRPAIRWGLLWGLAEATLGHILHAIPVTGLAGGVMVPVALVFMQRAYRESGQAAAVMSASAVAATIKLADLVLPGRGVLMAFRPALAILVEGLIISVLFAALPILVRRRA